MNAICELKVVSSLLGHFRTAEAPIVHVMQEDLPHVSFFALKQIQKKISGQIIIVSITSLTKFVRFIIFTCFTIFTESKITNKINLLYFEHHVCLF